MKMPRSSACLLASLMVLAGLRPASAAASRPDLTGRVTLQIGTPVADATVFVYTAGPRQGTGVLCPSCYPDCSKRARTDADGAFRISSLDPDLLFRLLVVAPGHEPRFVEKVDPLAGPALVFLEPLSPASLHSRSRMGGMVIDDYGRPVVGATISPEGVSEGQSQRWGGTDRFVDPLAVTDERGHFTLLSSESVQMVHALADGRGVAKRWVDLKPGRDHVIRMREGATVTGLVEHQGKPVPGAVLGLVTADRGAGDFLRCEELASDRGGRFTFVNVPPGKDLLLYAKMDSLPAGMALPSRAFRSPPSGGTEDLGRLPSGTAHRIAGRVVLTDGAPVPPGTRMYLGREGAWDAQEALLDAEGRFEFPNVPAESVSLGVRIPGYKSSKRNPNLDWLNGGLVGRVTGDMDDFVFLLEPGQWRHNGEEGEPTDGNRQPRDKPLRGAK